MPSCIGPTMPSWFIDIAFLEAAGIILVVTGCFVAGVISGFMEIAEAEKANRRRIAKERYAQNNVRDLLRCCSDSVTGSTTFYADNVAYMIVPDVDYRIATYWDGTQVIEYQPHETTERR